MIQKLIMKNRKVIVVILAFLLYFALLTLISFVRAPEEARAVGESLVKYENFEVTAEDSRAWVDANGLHFNDPEDTGKVFSTEIALRDLQQIMVSFRVDCPAELEGTAILHVDLCAQGYDSEEQEFIVELMAGQSEVITQMIDKGSAAPDEAQLRIFCLDAVQCDVSNVNVQVVAGVSRQSEIACVSVIAVLLLFLLVAVGKTYVNGMKKSRLLPSLEERQSVPVSEKPTSTSMEWEMMWIPFKKQHTIFKTNHAGERILFVLATVLFALTVVYIFTIWNLGFHSDSAAANILAREQMRTGQLFPNTWNTSTGLFIFFYNLFIIPFSAFTKNQILLRDLSVTIVLITFVLLLRYFSKTLLKSNFYLIALILFFAGTTPMIIGIAFAEAAYLIILLHHIILIILFLLSVTENWEINNKYCFVGLLIYLAYLSVYGPLSFAYYLIPFFGGGTLVFVLQYANSSWDDVRRVLVKIVKIIVPTAVAIAVGFFGYLVISQIVGFSSGTNIIYPDTTDVVNKFVQFILSAIGYRTGVSLFSLPGLINVLVVFGFIGLIVCCVLLFRKYYEQPFAVRMVMDISLAIFAIFVYLDFTAYCHTPGAERYFFVPYIFLIYLASYYIYTYILAQGIVIKVVVITLLATFSLPNMLAAIPQVAHYPQAQVAQLGLVNFLKANGLKHGYATFWNAGNNMVLSDFEVEIGGVSLTDPISPFFWLSSTTTYDPDSYSGESFLLLTGSENESYSNSYGMRILGEPKDILTFENYIIYIYPYNIAENNFEGQRLQNMEFIDRMCVSDPSMKDADGMIHLTAGQIIYGPYIGLSSGRFEIDLKFTEMNGDVYLLLTSGAGAKILQEQVLNEKEQTIYLDSEENLENFEVVLGTEHSAALSSVVISEVR